MSRIKKFIILLKSDEKLGKQIFLLSLISALFILAIVIRGPGFTGKYIVDNSGNIVGIQRGTLKNSEEYNLELILINKNATSESEKRRIKLKLAATESRNQKTVTTDDKEVETDAEINSIISDLELSNSKRIKLPDKLSNGTKLIWKVGKRDYSSLLFILITYFGFLVLLIKNRLDGKKDVLKENKKDIMRALPRFTNQLMLMLNAGMILNDAFERICISYSLMKENRQGYFEKKMIRIYENNIDHRISTANLISTFASESGVKELIRIATILTENERRGSDVIDNLSRESMYLWDEKKIRARECGKLIDTKMSYPLGILLILLIVITMAPAILSM